MPLSICREDILNIKAEAIVNPTDHFLSGSGGTDYQIHRAAGEKLKDECMKCLYLDTGDVFLTSACECGNCRYIIHTCGPLYGEDDGTREEELRSCYLNSLKLANENGITSIAFPLISSGAFAFPKGAALRIATDAIASFLLENEMMVYLLVYDNEAFDTASRLFTDIRDYLNRNLRSPVSNAGPSHPMPSLADLSVTGSHRKESALHGFLKEDYEEAGAVDYSISAFEPDESFSEYLIRMIDERGMTDPEVYKRANIDRKVFNHLKNDPNRNPRKDTAVALAIGLHLSLKETNDLLEKAGYVLSRSNKFDLIIRYCLEHGIYNIYQINEILLSEDQKTLGC